MPHTFLAAQFKQLGIDTYTHNFTLQYPLGDNKVCYYIILLYFIHGKFLFAVDL